MAGISEGGLETWMAAAADPRIRVAVSVIGVTRFQNIIDAASNGLAAEAYVKAFQQPLLAYARKQGATSVTPRATRTASSATGFIGRALRRSGRSATYKPTSIKSANAIIVSSAIGICMVVSLTLDQRQIGFEGHRSLHRTIREL